MTVSAIAAGDITLTCATVGVEWSRIVDIDISAGDVCPVRKSQFPKL